MTSPPRYSCGMPATPSAPPRFEKISSPDSTRPSVRMPSGSPRIRSAGNDSRMPSTAVTMPAARTSRATGTLECVAIQLLIYAPVPTNMGNPNENCPPYPISNVAVSASVALNATMPPTDARYSLSLATGTTTTRMTRTSAISRSGRRRMPMKSRSPSPPRPKTFTLFHRRDTAAAGGEPGRAPQHGQQQHDEQRSRGICRQAHRRHSRRDQTDEQTAHRDADRRVESADNGRDERDQRQVQTTVKGDAKQRCH